MSYILDALNKSEQERQQREHGMTLQPLTGVPHGDDKKTRWLPLIGVGIVLAAVLVFGVVYLFMQTREVTPAASTANPVAVARVQAPVETAAAPVLPNSSSMPPSGGVHQPETSVTGAANASVTSLYQRKGMSPEQAQVAADDAATDIKTFAPDEPAAVRAQTVPEAITEPAPSQANTQALQKALEQQLEQQKQAELAARVQAEIEGIQARDNAAVTRQAVPAKLAPVAEPGTSDAQSREPPAPLATDLPAAMQQRIPNIEFGAHVYAGRTGNGFVILNGKKRYAGDTVAPGLVVEKITEDGVILDMGGTRFRLESMRSWFN